MFQALEVIRQIKEADVMPIDRAQMRIKLTLPQKDAKQVLEKLRSSFTSIESEEWEGDLEIVSVTEL
jgi:ribosome maturation protein SDO1